MICGIAHVEFWVGNSLPYAFFYASLLGPSTLIHVHGLEQGSRQRTTRSLQCGRVTLRFTSTHAISKDEEFAHFHHMHGDSIRCIGLHSTDLEADFSRALQHGAVRIVSLPYTFTLEGSDMYHVLVPLDTAGTPLPAKSSMFCEIDHIAVAIAEESFDSVIARYEAAVGFERFLCSDDDDVNAGILIEGRSSGLATKVMACGGCKFVFVRPRQGKEQSQIQEFIDFHHGPGVAHIALSTSDIVSAVQHFTDIGVPVIRVPDEYYAELPARAAKHGVVIQEDVKELQRLSILVDFSRTQGYLLQTFTLPLEDVPTFYVEVIQRKHADGFGKGNITALFEAIERQQQQRMAGSVPTQHV
jgi:4-hydroxyphenylpyruvate dioxygenase